MKLNRWQASFAACASLSLAVTAFPASSMAAPSPQTGQSETIAQANCRRVNTTTNPLNIRATPNGEIVGSLAKGTLITIENTGTGGWVPIASPIRGYVYGEYLAPCTQPTPNPNPVPVSESCREVLSLEGVSVRQAPSTDSTVLGTLANRQRVTIVNRGAAGWVPISAPITGFIPSNVLIYCR